MMCGCVWIWIALSILKRSITISIRHISHKHSAHMPYSIRIVIIAIPILHNTNTNADIYNIFLYLHLDDMVMDIYTIEYQ